MYHKFCIIWFTSIIATTVDNPCSPSPCGPNSQCRPNNGQSVCSCVLGFIGSPPLCRPACVHSNECPLHQSCFNQKCQDPCVGTCGLGAKCTVVNHSPMCSCPSRYEGDPFNRCMPIGKLELISQFKVKTNVFVFKVERPADPVNPCSPSPCGPSAECRVIGESPSCSCLLDYIGSPPNCRPECVSNAECPSHLACVNQKCKNPCSGLCGANAECRVLSHTAMCVCLSGFTGDPFTQCVTNQIQIYEETRPCQPSPCGSNAVCHEQNGAGSCQCLSNYFGNPYDGCRPECVLNSDCPSNRACIQNRCVDPCPGRCGQNAECHVISHLPSCNCRLGYNGDPYRYCAINQVTRKLYDFVKTKII